MKRSQVIPRIIISFLIAALVALWNPLNDIAQSIINLLSGFREEYHVRLAFYWLVFLFVTGFIWSESIGYIINKGIEKTTKAKAHKTELE